MLIPGYVTDAIGLSLFVPGIRTAVGFLLISRLKNSAKFTGFATMNAGHHGSGTSSSAYKSHTEDEDIIEGEFEERAHDTDSLPRK